MKQRKRIQRSVHLATWYSPDVQRYIQKDNRLAFVPLGSFEQHGPHTPLGTDTFIILEICNRLALRLRGVVLPPVWFSISQEHMDFAGTITLTPDTLINLLTEIIISLQAGGFEKIVILNGHGGNESCLSTVRDKLSAEIGKKGKIQVLSYWDPLSEEEKKYLGSMEWGWHANAYETSLMSYIAPVMVKRLKGIENFPEVAVNQELDAELFRRLIKNSNGVWGDPSQASVKKGKELLVSIEAKLSEYLIQFWMIPEATH